MRNHCPEFACLTGRDESELVDYNGTRLHRCVRPDWRALQRAADAQGFELCAVSAWRSFDRQLAIFNAKARGEREVLDDCGEPVDLAALAPLAKLRAILRYSALPGASRHHWGTDFDVIDSAAVSGDYRVQLVDAEMVGSGPFAAMHNWLDGLIENDCAYGFFRPYTDQPQNRCSIAPERWHISHRPGAARFEAQLAESALYDFYAGLSGLELKQTVLDNFGMIYGEYIAAH